MKKLSIFFIVFAFTSMSYGKDLTNRLGVGVKNNRSISDLPQMAAVYYPSADLAVAAGIGIDTQESTSRFAFDASLRRIIFKEPNLNFYFGANVGLINYEQSEKKNSGYELNALYGAEFFFHGLDSLAFTFEGGVGILSTDKSRFRTIADHPFRAGVIFYF